MAEVNIQTVTLSGYKASVQGAQYLRLGTWDSYGIEQLQIVPGPEWTGLVIKAVFVTAAGTTPVVVPDSGLINVPPEATAQALGVESPGMIVFSGVTAGVQRITSNLLYLVSDHAPIDGAAPEPTPDEWAQFVAMVQQYAQQASQSATEAAGSATAAAGSATNAADSATQSAQSAADAAKSAQDAAAELEKVQGAGSAALQAIGTAQSTAVGAVQDAQQTGVDAVQGAQSTATQAIEQARQSAVRGVEQAGSTQTGAVNTAGQAQKTAIQKAGETATQQVQQAGQTAVDDVQQAQETSVQAVQDAQATAEEAINALVPDVYTKTESDARYAPIEAAIKVSGKGTGLVSLSPTVGWGMQGLALYGRSWQDGTPSVETEVPIQDAGQSGQVDVTVCGANFLDKTAVFTDLPAQNLVKYYPLKVADGQYTLSTTAPIYTETANLFFLSGNVSTGANTQINGVYNGKSITLNSDAGYITIGLRIYTTVNPNNPLDYEIMLNAGSTAQPYQPYTAQQLPIPTPDGLPGIPVTSGGNWVDENGQQWVSDVVDMAAETKAQNCAKYFPQNDTFFISLGGTGENAQTIFVRKQVQKGPNPHTRAVMCNFLSKVDAGIWNSDEECYNFAVDGYLDFRILKSRLSNANAAGVQAFCEKIGAEFLYALYEPITTPLDSATIAAYRALQSYPGTTNVLAPDAGIEASALAEPNQWVQEQIQAAVTQAVTQAVAITGGNT